MSYAASAALQAAVYQRLRANASIEALVGQAIYDAVPAGLPPETYISLGPEEVRDRSDKTGSGALHEFVVSIITDAAGFQQAKALAGAVSDALVGAELVLARGRLVDLWFLRARARRVGKADQRRIDLWFRAQVDID